EQHALATEPNERTLATHRDHAVGLRHVLVIDLGDRATGGRVREDPGVREVDRRADPRPVHVERGGPAAVDPSGLDDAAAVRQHARVVDGEPQLAVRGHRGGEGRREAEARDAGESNGTSESRSHDGSSEVSPDELGLLIEGSVEDRAVSPAAPPAKWRARPGATTVVMRRRRPTPSGDDP